MQTVNNEYKLSLYQLIVSFTIYKSQMRLCYNHQIATKIMQ